MNFISSLTDSSPEYGYSKANEERAIANWSPPMPRRSSKSPRHTWWFMGYGKPLRSIRIVRQNFQVSPMTWS